MSHGKVGQKFRFGKHPIGKNQERGRKEPEQRRFEPNPALQLVELLDGLVEENQCNSHWKDGSEGETKPQERRELLTFSEDISNKNRQET